MNWRDAILCLPCAASLSIALATLTVAAQAKDAPAHKPVLRILADPWCPYTCKKGDEKKGVLLDFVDEISKSRNIPIQYDETNWARAIIETRAGKADAILGAQINDANDFIFPKTPMMASHSCFYTVPGSKWTYTGVESLQKITVGVIKDYAYGEPLDSYVMDPKRGNIDFTHGDDPFIRTRAKLLSKRIDALVEDENVAMWYQSQDKQEKKISKAGCLEQVEFFIAFSPFPEKAKTSREWAEAFSSGMDELFKNGRAQQILAKYGLKASK